MLEALVRSLAPSRASDQPPGWLRRGQHDAFARVVAAVRRYRGALLAEPAGTGKTWIALAVARAIAGSAACVVPAAAREHWDRIGRRTGVPIVISTHEAWSRAPRQLGGGLVIVDEAHRFRNPGTHRTRHLAPALVGRAGLLLTATPLVNHLTDLSGQLRLLIRDDALAGAGTPSLDQALRSGQVPQSLSDLVVGGTVCDQALPATAILTRRWRSARWLGALVRQLDGLALSTEPELRSLIRTVFLTALASSPEAVRATASRYRLLLLQHADALRTGRCLPRHAIRRLSPGLTQTLLWDLLPAPEQQTDLCPDDLPRLESLITDAARALQRRDPKLDVLTEYLRDAFPTVVFTSFTDTVHYLRSRLSPAGRIAWCTGARAGIGGTTLPRRSVLRWFRPATATAPDHLMPAVLVTTDVAGESVDLHRACRVVHYDLPWTAMRLDQRAGRVRRLGQTRTSVEVLQLLPPVRLERRVGQQRAVDRKAALPALLALDRGPGHPWLIRDRLSAGSGTTPSEGEAWACCDGFRAVAGLTVAMSQQPERALVLVLPARGEWSDDIALVEPIVGLIRNCASGPGSDRIRGEVITSLGRYFAHWRREAASALWGSRHPGPRAVRALASIREMVRLAARARDPAALRTGEQALSFLRRGHTVGEAMLADRIAGLAPERIAALIPAEHGPPPVPPIRIRLRTLILSSSFGECHSSAPSSSTSTEPWPTRSG